MIVNEKIKKPKYSVSNSLVSYYLLIMFTFFPLFLTENSYAHARTDKFWLFLALTVVLFLSVGGASLINISENRKKGIREQHLIPFSPTDIAMLCFFLFAAISTVISPYPLDALVGLTGRNNGLITLALYLIAYFIVSRFYVFKEYVLALYLVFSSAVALLTVINFYYIDPFGILEGYSDKVVEDFGTTIGNKNTIASFMTLFLPVAIMLFVLIEKRWLKVIAGISIGAAYTGVICANSNSGYLGSAVVLMLMLIFCARDCEKLRQYMLALVILFSSGKLLRLFSYLMHDHSKSFETIPNFLLYSGWMYVPIGFFLIVFLLMTGFRRGAEKHYHPALMKGIFITFFSLILLSVAGAFFYFSVIDLESDLGDFEKLLRFNDQWGTHRGFMWINGMKEYQSFDFIHQLFGSGPDTFYHVFEPHFAELLDRFGDSSTNCIHNEYLNYLITQGIVGLLSYLGIIVFSFIRAVKKSYENPMTLVFISAVIGYAAQAVVNLYQPITTPTLFLFIAISEALSRKN